jgi:hypothetical protein
VDGFRRAHAAFERSKWRCHDLLHKQVLKLMGMDLGIVSIQGKLRRGGHLLRRCVACSFFSNLCPWQKLRTDSRARERKSCGADVAKTAGARIHVYGRPPASVGNVWTRVFNSLAGHTATRQRCDTSKRPGGQKEF